MRVKVLSQKITQVYSEVLVVGFFQDVRPPGGMAGEVDWVCNGVLSHLILAGKTEGTIGDAVLFISQRLPSSQILFVGMGERALFGYPALTALSADIVLRVGRMGVGEAAIELLGVQECPLDPARAFDSLLSGIKEAKMEKELFLTVLVHTQDMVDELEQQINSLACSR